MKISNDFSREMLKFMKISNGFSREVLKFMKISSDFSREMLKFTKTNAETILGQSSSGTTLEYIFGFLFFVFIVLPIGIAYWPLLFPCGRTGPCYSLVEALELGIGTRKT